MTEKEQQTFYYRNADFLHRAAAVAANTTSVSASTTLVFKPLPTMAMDSAPERIPQAVTLNPTFKYGFWGTCAFTVLMLIVSALLAVLGPDTDGTKTLLELCEHLLSLGFGAVIGLIGGKAAG